MREIWEKEQTSKALLGASQKRMITHMSASNFSYFIWNSVLKSWAVNWTSTQTSKKTSIINIDVSSVYLRFICIHIKKPERINCLLLRNTWLLQFSSATKTLPTTRLKNSFFHMGLLSIQKRHCRKSSSRLFDFFSPTSWDIKTMHDKKLWE